MNTAGSMVVNRTMFCPNQHFADVPSWKLPKRIESTEKRFVIDRKPIQQKGRGGEIFKGLDTVLDIPVAMKVDTINGRPDAIKLNVARGLAKLNIPGIIKVYEIVFPKYKNKEKLAVIYEWLEGVSLDTYNGTFGQYLDIYSSVATTLDLAHKRKVVHNDIAPDNIIVDNREDRRTIIDWDLSNLASERRVSFRPDLASPHAMESDIFLPQDDNWSLLASIYWSLTKDAPFRDPENKNINTYKHLSLNPEFISIVGKEVARKLDNFFLEKLTGDFFQLLLQ